MKMLKEWWEHLASDTKLIFVLLVVAMVAVVYYCGIKGNNQDNFYYKAPEAEEIAQADTTKKPVILINLPHRPSRPIKGINILHDFA